MPTIKSSAELTNDYNDAVMSIESYEQHTTRIKLYDLLKDGMREVHDGNTRPLSAAMSDIRSRSKS